jgi:hypothetical protein
MLLSNNWSSNMKYALANEQRLEAQPGLSGKCPSCEAPMVAKCGEVKIWHWAHQGKRVCDHWWENETEWHRAWKSQFPDDWQEIVHRAEDGEKHIADVKTDLDWVIEFQYSHIKPDERRSRDSFYPKLAWVVNGDRRTRYKKQFMTALDEMGPVHLQPLVHQVYLDLCVPLRDWAGSHVPVFFDFQEEPVLWCLLPNHAGMWVYVAALHRSDFIKLVREDSQGAHDLQSWLQNLGRRHPAERPIECAPPIQRRPEDVLMQLARMNRGRFRRRF